MVSGWVLGVRRCCYGREGEYSCAGGGEGGLEKRLKGGREAGGEIEDIGNAGEVRQAQHAESLQSNPCCFFCWNDVDGDGTNLRVVQHRLLHDGAYLQLAFGEHDCWDPVVMTKRVGGRWEIGPPLALQ